MAFPPVSSQNSQASNWNQLNDMIRQLNKEQTTKVFKQPGGNVIIEGKLPYEGGYGSLYYDTNGIPRVLIGIAPDGTVGLFVSKVNVSVLSAFS